MFLSLITQREQRIQDNDAQRRMGDSYIHREPNITAKNPNLAYGGHLIWHSDFSALSGPSGYQNNDNTSYAAWTTFVDTDVTDLVPKELPDVNGIQVGISVYYNINSAKILKDSDVLIQVDGLFNYGTISPTMNIYQAHDYYNGLDTGQVDWQRQTQPQKTAPLTRDGNKYYLTSRLYTQYKNLSTEVGIYRATITYFVQGFLI